MDNVSLIYLNIILFLLKRNYPYKQKEITAYIICNL